MSSTEYVSAVNQMRGINAMVDSFDNKIQGNTNQALETLSTAAKDAIERLYLAFLAYNPI